MNIGLNLHTGCPKKTIETSDSQNCKNIHELPELHSDDNEINENVNLKTFSRQASFLGNPTSNVCIGEYYSCYFTYIYVCIFIMHGFKRISSAVYFFILCVLYIYS